MEIFYPAHRLCRSFNPQGPNFLLSITKQKRIKPSKKFSPLFILMKVCFVISSSHRIDSISFNLFFSQTVQSEFRRCRSRWSSRSMRIRKRLSSFQSRARSRSAVQAISPSTLKVRMSPSEFFSKAEMSMASKLKLPR